MTLQAKIFELHRLDVDASRDVEARFGLFRRLRLCLKRLRVQCRGLGSRGLGMFRVSGSRVQFRSLRFGALGFLLCNDFARTWAESKLVAKGE